MALPTHDPLKHHVGLAPVGDPLDGFILSGAYRRDPQRQGGSTEYGGEGDVLSAGTLARWTQDDFSGGGYQDQLDDDAMFASCQNLLPNLLTRTARSVPPLEFFDLAGVITADSALGVFATGGKVLVIDPDKTRYFDAETGAVVTTTDPAREFQAAAHDPADNLTYAVTKATASSDHFLVQSHPQDGSSTTIATFPATAPNPARGMCVTAGRDIVIQMGTTLYLADVNDDRTSATFVRIGRLPGRWRDAVTYNGMTYILLSDAEQRTQLVTWDGTQILPVTDFPYNFIGRSLGVYGGRIYCGGSATDLTGTDRFAELYEITGASLRLVRSYANEARAGQFVPTNFYSMVVHEGLLFLGTDIDELVAYDLTRDAIWPGFKLRSPSSGATAARHLLSTREKLFVWADALVDATAPGGAGAVGVDNGFYRLSTVDADVTAAYTSFLETSDFVPEPDRLKRWAKFRLVSRYDVASVEASQDGGATWTGLVGTAVQTGDLNVYDYTLAGLDPSASIRFRMTSGTSGVSYSEFVAFTCSFFWLDNGKSSWSFTVLGSEVAEAIDGTSEEQDVAAIRSTLWSYWQTRENLTFKDLDGTSYTVYVSDFSELQPTIAEAVDSSGTREALYSVVLTEL